MVVHIYNCGKLPTYFNHLPHFKLGDFPQFHKCTSNYPKIIHKSDLWRFPEKGVAPNDPPAMAFSVYKPTILGYPHGYGNPQAPRHNMLHGMVPDLLPASRPTKQIRAKSESWLEESNKELNAKRRTLGEPHVNVCAQQIKTRTIYIYIYVHTYVYIYVCICIYVYNSSIDLCVHMSTPLVYICIPIPTIYI